MGIGAGAGCIEPNLPGLTPMQRGRCPFLAAGSLATLVLCVDHPLGWVQSRARLERCRMASPSHWSHRAVDDRPPFNLVDGLLRRYQVVLAIAGICLIIAAALSVLLPKTYQATAIIYLDTARTATDFDAGIAAGDLLQHDFIVSANSRPTLQEACTTPAIGCSASDLVAPETTIGKLVSASVYRGTSELAIEAKGRTPADAAALANAVAQAVIDQDSAEVIRLY